MASPLLRLGTRGSALALAQAAEVRARLAAAQPELAAPDAIEIVPIRTSGDRQRQAAPGSAGNKGLFTKEIEEALRRGAIDIAVHSLKDLPTLLPEGLRIACYLPREDPRDALIAGAGVRGLTDLPKGATVGTSSVRRRAQLLHARPDLRIIEFRGNVDTRLDKVAAGAVDAAVLAVAGLIRLGRAERITAILTPQEMLPAAAQGAIAIETRADDEAAAAWLAPLNDEATACCVAAERALLAALDGSCRTPIAALAQLSGKTLTLEAMILRPDGRERLCVERRGDAGAAAALGRDAGDELRARASADLLAFAVLDGAP